MKRKGLRLVYTICLALLLLLFVIVVLVSLQDKDYGVGVIACLLFLICYHLLDRYGSQILRSSWFRWNQPRRRHLP